jgi:peptide/nickel transport system substrate-binding protein
VADPKPSAIPVSSFEPTGAQTIYERALSRRAILKVGLFGGVATALAACGGTPPTASTTVSSAAPASAPASNAAPSVAARGGTIRMGAFEGGLTDGFLPWKSFGQEFAWNWCAQTLLTVAPDGSIVYELAKSHDVSPDGKTYTFHLVDGVKWHDGKPFTADDVAFTYNAALKTKAASNYGGRLAPIKGSKAVNDDNAKDAEGIKVVDPMTISFELDEPNAQILPNLFANLRIAPKHAFEGMKLEDYPNAPISNTLFVGTGPYKMTEFKVKEFVNFEAYPDYKNGTGFSGLPAADKVSIRIYDNEDAQILSTQSGEVDFNYVRKPSGDKLKVLKAIQGMHTQPSQVGFNIFFAVNLLAPSTPLLKDKRVRQALVWALDRDTLVNDVLGGVFKVPEIMNQWIAPWANSDKLERYYPQNIDKAKQLLADAGWDSSIQLDIRHYPPKLDPDVPVILEMWKAVGVTGKLTPFGEEGFVHDFYEDKDKKASGDQGPSYDIGFVYGYGTLDGSPWGSDETLGSKRVYPNGYNSMRWVNAEWDSEYAAALKETSQDAQAPHFKRCSELFNDELPYAPIYQRVDYSIVNDKLKGVEKATITHPAAGGVHYWEWYIEA